MPACIRSLAILALGLGLASVSKAAVGDFGKGSTTRYWDCCKGAFEPKHMVKSRSGLPYCLELLHML